MKRFALVLLGLSCLFLGILLEGLTRAVGEKSRQG